MKHKHKIAFVASDQHFPLHDPAAISCAVQAIELVKPDIFINIGDAGEWNSVSSWKWKGKKQPPLEYQLPVIEKDINEVNEGLDLFDEVLNRVKCKTRHMLEGNHDDWTNRFVERYPYMKEIAFKKACNLESRGYVYSHP